jgi:hypothetical protein
MGSEEKDYNEAMERERLGKLTKLCRSWLCSLRGKRRKATSSSQRMSRNVARCLRGPRRWLGVYRPASVAAAQLWVVLRDRWTRVDTESSRATEDLQIANSRIEQLRNKTNLRVETRKMILEVSRLPCLVSIVYLGYTGAGRGEQGACNGVCPFVGFHV